MPHSLLSTASIQIRPILVGLLLLAGLCLCSKIQAASHSSRHLQLNRALTQATELSHLSRMRALLDAGADPNWNRTNSARYPLLLIATLNGNPSAVRMLLRYGASPERRDIKGTPVIISAAIIAESHPNERKILNAIYILLREGRANPQVRDIGRLGDQRTALHVAAASGNLRLAYLLLKYGANPNAFNGIYETPLHFAAQRGHLNVIRLLTRFGARPNIQSRYQKMTPLLLASQGGHAHIVHYLLKNGANPLHRDTFGKSSLALARQGYQRTPARPLKRNYLKTIGLLRTEILKRYRTQKRQRARQASPV